jgi:hypothetical protein
MTSGTRRNKAIPSSASVGNARACGNLVITISPTRSRSEGSETTVARAALDDPLNAVPIRLIVVNGEGHFVAAADIADFLALRRDPGVDGQPVVDVADGRCLRAVRGRQVLCGLPQAADGAPCAVVRPRAWRATSGGWSSAASRRHGSRPANTFGPLAADPMAAPASS